MIGNWDINIKSYLYKYMITSFHAEVFFNICDNGSMNTCGVNVMEELTVWIKLGRIIFDSK